MENNTATGFKDLLNQMMSRRWYITAMVLGGFMLIIGGIFAAIVTNTVVAGAWKELLMLLLGAFIGSYGKIIDYWFSDTDKDKMLVQKMDEEDGVSMSNTADMPPPSPMNPSAAVSVIHPGAFENASTTLTTASSVTKVEIDEDGDGTMDGYDIDGDGKIDEYFAHRQCEHVWGDSDGDGDEECLKCGKIKDVEESTEEQEG
jgi:hypothetical protein